MSQKWLRIEVEFESEPEWADDVNLKYYVLMGEGRREQQKMFVGEVTHINVHKDNRHYSAMFMHPNAVERFGKGKVVGAAALMFHQSKLVDMKSKPEVTQRWWEGYSPTPGFLVNVFYTPWSIMSFERYEDIKLAP